jgi:hypothetical protein
MSALPWRGLVEGFYGPPWSHRARLDYLAFAAEIGLNVYVYAPKDDPYHRDRWREPCPAAELERLAELARAAHELGIRFVYAISPALSMRFTDDAEHAALQAKAGQLFDVGVRSFGLLFDDVPQELADPADAARFGAGRGGAGAAHGETCRRFVAEFLAPRGIEDPLLVCPTDYAGIAESDYRIEFANAAPEDILLTWTGADVVVGAVTGAEIDSAARSYRRPLLLWDNFPVNDFDPARLFLGPLTGRHAHGAESALLGVIANPMPQALSSRFALVTVADWARDPAGYRPTESARRASDTVAAALEPLVRVCSAWPPSADQDPELTAATKSALTGDPAALDLVAHRLSELAEGCRAAREPAALVAELRPWLDGAVAMAEAGLAAVRLLRTNAGRAETRAALDAAEEHYANVLRPIVPPFVRDVLALTEPEEPDGKPIALLVTGQVRSPGDRATAELLTDCGFAVRRAADDVDLVVVTGTAEPDAIRAVADAPVPLVAWRAGEQLGLARGRRTVMTNGRMTVVDSSDELAAGRSGTLSALRGPAWLTVSDVDDTPARVIVEMADGGAAVFRYATGDRLANGTVAAGPRIGLFLGGDGPARWLLTEDGQALIRAAIG